MRHRVLLLPFGFFALVLSPIVEAASSCEWESTRKRNRHEKLCYHAMGPVSGIWSVAPELQAKLERCLMHTKTAHILEHAECKGKTQSQNSRKKQ